MTTIDVDTSPLQAAREWRGIGRVAAALSAGLPAAHVEALECGSVDAFNSVDEMIAAAVVYGASLGIGRDEAVALLDRTISASVGVSATLPDVEDAPAPDFSAAVRERSARMAARPQDSMDVPLPLEPLDIAPIEPRVFDLDEPQMPASLERELPEVPVGPTPAQAVEASQEFHLDPIVESAHQWDGESPAGELETWAHASGSTQTYGRDGLGVRVGDAVHATLERVIGTDRADQVADWTAGASERLAELTRSGRERLRRSEHATLIVAIGVGAILIALLVAIGGALGGDTEPKVKATGPDTSPPVTAQVQPATGADTATDPEAATKSTATPAPMVKPAMLRIDVFNAGSRKGYAKDVAAKVKGFGYRVGSVGNAKSPFSAATIVYPAGFEREARVLGKHVGVTRLQEGHGAARQLMLVVV